MKTTSLVASGLLLGLSLPAHALSTGSAPGWTSGTVRTGGAERFQPRTHGEIALAAIAKASGQGLVVCDAPFDVSPGSSLPMRGVWRDDSVVLRVDETTGHKDLEERGVLTWDHAVAGRQGTCSWTSAELLAEFDQPALSGRAAVVGRIEDVAEFVEPFRTDPAAYQAALADPTLSTEARIVLESWQAEEAKVLAKAEAMVAELEAVLELMELIGAE